jgi:hypothetical protein
MQTLRRNHYALRAKNGNAEWRLSTEFQILESPFSITEFCLRVKEADRPLHILHFSHKLQRFTYAYECQQVHVFSNNYWAMLSTSLTLNSRQGLLENCNNEIPSLFQGNWRLLPFGTFEWLSAVVNWQLKMVDVIQGFRVVELYEVSYAKHSE